jgi:serine/threonine protein kinase
MSPGTRPAGVPPEMADENAIKAWLEALASGGCDEPAFLLFAQERLKSDPEGSWEVLSQLDQFYRRGRIKPDTFQSLKHALSESALGARSIPPVRDAAARDAAARDAPAREIPVVRDIPVARDVVVQQSMRTELSDTHAHREEAPAADAAGEIKRGSVLRRRYRIESAVGQGAMGTVYQALDEYRLETQPGGQRLAIKVLHPAVTKRAELLTELRRKFQQMQLLSHPNIVRMFEFDRDGSVMFFTMELLVGAPLSRVLQGRNLVPLERAQALAAIRDIGAALAHAHSRGVVHGDINPQNIFVKTGGELRVLAGSPTADDGVLPAASLSYASCQVLAGERADERDDVFSLACIAYLLLCGEHSFSKKTAIEAREAGLTPRRPPGLTNRQWRTLRAGISFERADRPADLQQWLDQLDTGAAAKHLAPLGELLEPPSVKKSKSLSVAVVTAAVAAAVALVSAGSYWIVKRQDPPALTTTATRAASTPNPLTPPIVVPSVTAPPALAPSVAPSAAAPATAAPAAAGRPAAAPPPAASPVSAPPPVPPAGAASSPAKIELAVDTVDVPSAEASAQIAVHRKGSLRGETSFTWWTESGTAKPGIDFAAVVPQLAYIGEGKSSISLNIPLTAVARTQSKSFYVVIDQSQGGALLGARTLTMVTLLPGD